MSMSADQSTRDEPAVRAAVAAEPWATKSWGPFCWRLAKEASLLLVLYAVYAFARFLASKHAGAAFDHAHAVWHIERDLKLPSEDFVQRAILDVPRLAQVANWYYAHVHFPLTIAVLAWLFIWRRTYYRWIRWVLVTVTGVSMMVHLAYPLAPPRMLHADGLIDTGIRYGQSVYDAPGHGGLANQYAAMPSLHIGWAFLLAIGMIYATRSKWRWLWLSHPIITTLVVVGTANHYWLDGIVVMLLLSGAFAINGRLLPSLAINVEKPKTGEPSSLESAAVATRISPPALTLGSQEWAHDASKHETPRGASRVFPLANARTTSGDGPGGDDR